jgi:glycosyltransferase 2 family protein
VSVTAERTARRGRIDRRRVLGLVAGLLITGFLVYALVSGWQRISDYDWQLSWGWLVGGLALLLVFYLASGVGYLLILERLHATPPHRLVTLSVWARSLLGRYVPGNVLMVLGRTELGRGAGVPRRISLAATVYEQAFGLAAAAVGSLVFLAVYSDLGEGSAIWLVGLVLVFLVLLHPRLFRRLSSWALRRVGREPLPRYLATGEMAGLLAWYAVTAGLVVVSVWALVHSAAPDAGGPGFVGLAFLLSFTVSMLTFIFPAGLGVRDGIFALALSQNLPGSVAVTVSVGLRLVMTCLELAFVGACALAARRR